MQQATDAFPAGRNVTTNAGNGVRGPTKAWTLDGDRIEIEGLNLWADDRVAAEAMEVGDEIMLGGGAFAEFALKRVA